MNNTEKIYIILSYSGTLVSKIIKYFTKYEYCHVSLSFDKDIDKMYSFGRKKVYNVFDAGFIIENRNNSFFKKFTNTKCVILEVSIDKNKYKKLQKIVEEYIKNEKEYKYDIVGLLLRIINIKIDRKHHYVCTEFVKTILEEANIYKFDTKIVKAIDFMELPNKKIIYDGLLLEY